MNLVQPTFEILQQENGLKGIYKAIEYPGRICYGSTDKITEDSAEAFVHRLEAANHGAPMEHGAVYLHVARPVDYDEWLSPSPASNAYDDLLEFYSANEYSKVNEVIAAPYEESTGDKKYDLYDHLYVSTNYRVLFENKRLDDLKYLCDPTIYHQRRVTVKFTCNIGVSREYNRHRKDSINEESTRYCNYSKDKYGNEISVIANNNKFGDRLEDLTWANNNFGLLEYCVSLVNQAKDLATDDLYEHCNFTDIDYWLFANKAAEFSYIGLTGKCGWKAQDARDILPIDTKSILVHTAFIDDWKHFFDLRAKGTTGAPHPQAKELAEPLMQEFIKKGYICG
jgi:thymidylate synthase (FAD)